MKSLKKLLLTTSIAAAFGGIGLAPVVGQSATLQANQLGTPNDGMICRSGYNGALSGAAFKCSKTRVISLVLECNDPKFPTYVVRAVGAPGTPDGKDICTRNGVSVGSTDSVVGLVRTQDYVFAAVNPATVTTRTDNQDQSEATSLGLSASEVETEAAAPSIVLNGGIGSKDNANVILTHFTFPIKTGGIVIGSPFPAR